MSRVHVLDAAAATLAALERGRPGQAYNIVDHEPASWRDYCRAVARALGAPTPRAVPAWVFRAMPYLHPVFTGSYRVANAKATTELAWDPAFPTYREGVRAMATP
ncbi:hypothetical protein [Nonomuraea aridisoli]|uniref:NAD(P)-dependent oxidoreductase n=1 Tax=Nonomuraea aridisoli TaxID=2070368 RepID=A0A2W2G5A8_9ACTN|nr:hypothetical protein [Nonomuraea aridisoli]PZG22084.1 hypothetical protein C1J01_04735 [Nonomuraea aridisoli]